MRVLVVNAGSSSVKLRLTEGDAVLGSVDLDATAGEFDEDELNAAVDAIGSADAAGHRVVHGGTRFTEPVVIEPGVVDALRELTPLAPLHQPFALAAIEATGRAVPDLPHVACFDTAFHATIPTAAATYAVPAEWRERWPIRRFGFHGLSHAYAARRAAELCDRAGDDPRFRVVTCHLGAGASLTAVRGGRSVDTTMGFTPLEGLVMATRSGTVDPGLVLWLVEQGGLAPAEVRDGLDHHGGLTALAGTADMREVLGSDAPGARLALDVYVASLCRHLAGMVASLGGVDAVVFTGGVGEHAAPVRAFAAQRLGFLGIGVDPTANGAVDGDAEVTGPDAPVRTFVVTAREDVEIARSVRALLA